MTKTQPTTEMKSIDWQHLDELDMTVTSEVISACAQMHLHAIMDFNCDWNEKVVA